MREPEDVGDLMRIDQIFGVDLRDHAVYVR